MSRTRKMEISILKDYKYRKRFKIIEKTPMDEIKGVFSQLFIPKGKGGRAKKRPSGFKETKAKGLNFGFIVGGLLILFLVVYIMFLRPVPSGFMSSGIPASVSGIPKVILIDKDIVDFGTKSDNKYAAYALLKFDSPSRYNCTISIEPRVGYVDDAVYILDADIRSKSDKDTVSEFISYLSSALTRHGISNAIIGAEQLDKIPPHSILVIPSQYFPKYMLIDYPFTKLLSRNVDVMFIGYAFDQGLLDKSGNIVSGQKYGNINFGTTRSTCVGINMHNPLYTISEGGYEGSKIYGCIPIYTLSAYTSSGLGKFIIFPQSLSTGWIDIEHAADDVLKVIVEQVWVNPISEPKMYNCGAFKDYEKAYIYTNPIDKSYAGVVITLSSNISNITYEKTILFNAQKSSVGNLHTTTPGVLVPYEMTQEPTTFVVEAGGTSDDVKDFYIDIYSSDGAQETKIPLGGLSMSSVKAVNGKLHTKKGEYLLVLKDAEGNVYGKMYAQSTFIDINYMGRSGDAFVFSFKKSGEPYNVKNVEVSIDNGAYGVYSFNNINEIFLSPKSELPEGNRIFSFKIGEVNVDLPVRVVKTYSLINDPLIWGTLVIAGIFVVIGTIFARKEEIVYTLDIPDFVPFDRREVVLSVVQILRTFDEVNKEFGWKYTPLKVNEIKMGLRKIQYEGKPINTTQHNVENVLAVLSQWGYVYKVKEYYIPITWVRKTEKSPKYLALFRKLRDVCVENAVYFTEFNKSKECDSLLTAGDNNIYLHIIDDPKKIKPEKIASILKKIPDGINVVLFNDKYDMDKFKDILLIPDVPNTILKIEVDTYSVILVSVDELGALLRQLKYA